MSHIQSTFVTDWLAKRAVLSPDRIGLVDYATGVETTFAQWDARANQTAHYLVSLGISKGDLVAVYSSNCPEYLDLFFAAAKIGAVLQNLNWRLTVHELSGIIADASPRALIYSADWAEQVAELRPSLDTVEHVVALGTAQPGDRRFGERDDLPTSAPDRPALTMDDPWGIYYTGGTTGLPKGAILTHGNITWNSINTITSWGIHGGHVAALQLPIFHVGGPNIFMVPLVHTGGMTILCREFDVDETFDLIDRAGVTHYVGVPTMYQMLQADDRWDSTDFSRLELVISGGAPCPLPIKEKFWDRGIDFKVGYGLTEASGNNFWLPSEKVREKPDSVGFPLFHIDMKVIDPEGKEVAAGEPGQLLIKGAHVTPGYYRRPEATAETIVDGWLHTGDLATRDAEGFFEIIGRSKDMFISGGENVYPAEVESVMLSHPAVAEAAMVGVPHEKWGEVGRAFLVIDTGAEFDEADFLEFLGDRMARYKLPRSVIVLAELPKTVIGKLDKKVLAAMEVEA
jgi:fatty-acyl-CoA synthase